MTRKISVLFEIRLILQEVHFFRSLIEDWKRDSNKKKGSLFGSRHSSKRILIYMI